MEYQNTIVMKKVLFLALCLSVAAVSQAQNIQSADSQPLRYIDVTGVSETEIDPDNIKFTIRIREYWKEEFEKRAKEENFKTKVPLSEIENDLINALTKAGVKKEQIFVQDAGNYGRQTGKDFLNSKQFELSLDDFKTVDKIIKTVTTRGIDYMNISELNNSNMDRYRLEAKVQALKAAKEKALVLVEALDEELGQVIYINDNGNNYAYPKMRAVNVMYSAGAEMESDMAVNSVDTVRKIKLEAQVSVRFQIKNR